MFDNSTMPAKPATATGTPPERQTVLHSWWIQTQWDAPTINGGEGARLFTADGRSILDMSSLAECSNLGHQHPRLVAAIRGQAQKLCFVASSLGSTATGALRQLLDKAMNRGVSFAARGNLILLAPPLIIGERELADALNLLDRLIGELAVTLKGMY